MHLFLPSSDEMALHLVTPPTEMTFFKCEYKREPSRLYYGIDGTAYIQRKATVCARKDGRCDEYDVDETPGVCRHCGKTYDEHGTAWITFETSPSRR